MTEEKTGTRNGTALPVPWAGCAKLEFVRDKSLGSAERARGLWAARHDVAAGGGGRLRAGAFCRFPTNLAPKVCAMTALGPLRTIEQDRRR